MAMTTYPTDRLEVTRPIPVQPSRYDDGLLVSDVVLKMAHCRYLGHGVRLGIGYVPPTAAARRTTGGELVPGPWVYTYPLASIIDNYGGTAAESARKLAEGTEYEAKVGDLFEVDGRVYELTDTKRFGYPELTLLEEVTSP